MSDISAYLTALSIVNILMPWYSHNVPAERGVQHQRLSRQSICLPPSPRNRTHYQQISRSPLPWGWQSYEIFICVHVEVQIQIEVSCFQLFRWDTEQLRCAVDMWWKRRKVWQGAPFAQHAKFKLWHRDSQCPLSISVSQSVIPSFCQAVSQPFSGYVVRSGIG